jgi:hypothetical protein
LYGSGSGKISAGDHGKAFRFNGVKGAALMNVEAGEHSGQVLEPSVSSANQSLEDTSSAEALVLVSVGLKSSLRIGSASRNVGGSEAQRRLDVDDSPGVTATSTKVFLTMKGNRGAAVCVLLPASMAINLKVESIFTKRKTRKSWLGRG